MAEKAAGVGAQETVKQRTRFPCRRVSSCRVPVRVPVRAFCNGRPAEFPRRQGRRPSEPAGRAARDLHFFLSLFLAPHLDLSVALMASPRLLLLRWKCFLVFSFFRPCAFGEPESLAASVCLVFSGRAETRLQPGCKETAEVARAGTATAVPSL